MEALWILGLVVVWLLLQIWILPRLGVRTCLSGGCGIESESSGRSFGGTAPAREGERKTIGD